MKTLLIISFTDISKDVRILRHIEILNKDFEITTCGFGITPKGSRFHLQIPSNLKYLPLNLKAFLANQLKFFRFSYHSTPAVVWTLLNLKKTIHTYDAVLCNDVLTSGIPTLLEFNGMKVLDMHEYAPLEMEDDWKFRIFLQKYYFWLCKNYLENFDRVVTVSEGIATKYFQVFGKKCDVVLNAREFEKLEPSVSVAGVVRIVHSGLALKNRKLNLIIEACSRIDNVTLDLFLVPASREKAEYKKLKNQAAKTSNCKVREPVPADRLAVTLNSFDVGLYFMTEGNFNNENCLPNKFFDFIQARLMLVVSPVPEMSKIVLDNEIGRVTDDFSLSSLKKLLSNLTREEINYYKDKTNLVARKFSMESESIKLRQIFNEDGSAWSSL